MQDDGALGAPLRGHRQLTAAASIQQRRTTYLHAGLGDLRADPQCRFGGEPAGCRDIQAALPGGGHDGARQRVFTVGLGGCGQGQHRIAVMSGGRFDAGQGRGALGQGASLIEEHHIDGAHLFQGQAVFDQNAAAGGALSGDRNHQRDGQPQRVWAGDDQHCNGSHHRGIGVPQRRPGNCGDDGRCQREPEQPAGRGVSDPLSPRRGGLCIGNQPLDTGQRSVGAHGTDLHAQPRICGHRTGYYLLTDPTAHGR
ncbi:Uncharacterised protein [Mycobacteroides abscessus subsp. abscessus]|nr:Uncharacterised protein [Mycobacteroides abscessus subsp. abscessus]